MNVTRACAQPEFQAIPAEAGRLRHRAATRAGFQRSIKLAGPAGRLEALLNEGASDAPLAALVCHPHPLGGGTLHNKVVYHAMKVFNASQWGFQVPVLRFNFRGVGLSRGQHDGEAEIDDVETALAWLENEFQIPIVAAGFSFGAAMVFKACWRNHRARKNIRALAALGLPVEAGGRDYKYPFLEGCTLPKLFLSGDRDQFAPRADLERVASSTAPPTQLIFIPGADHFFAGQLKPMQQALAGWLKEQML